MASVTSRANQPPADSPTALEVFAKSSAAQPWRVTFAPRPAAKGVKLPQIALDAAGYATAVPGTAPLVMHPADLAKPVYVLKTTDGGALAFYATQDHLDLRVPRGSFSTLSAIGRTEVALLGPGGGYTQLTVTRLLQFAVHLPRAGRVSVLAAYGGTVNVAGT